MDNEELNGDLSELESQLRTFSARSSSLDRDRLMFLAGQESVRVDRSKRIGSWLWPLATAFSMATSVWFAIQLFHVRSSPQAHSPLVRHDVKAKPVVKSELVVSGDTQDEVPPAAHREPVEQTSRKFERFNSVSVDSLLHTRDVALRFGVEALPGTLAAADSVTISSDRKTHGQWIEDFSRDLKN